MPTFTGAIDQFRTVSKGVKNNKPWVLYGVDAGGKTYTTFSEDYREKVGQSVTFEYDEVPNGQFVNYRIRGPKKTQNGDPQIVALLTEIRDLLAESLRR